MTATIPEDESRALSYFLQKFMGFCEANDFQGKSNVMDIRQIAHMTGKWALEAYRHGKQTENVAN